MNIYSIPSQELLNFRESLRTDKDCLDRTSDFLLSPLHWAFGKETYTVNSGSEFSLAKRVSSSAACAFLFLLFLPLTGTMTLLGLSARKLSPSYNRNYKDLGRQVKDLDRGLGTSVFKKAVYEATLAYKSVRALFGYQWWNEVASDKLKEAYPDAKIYLGALPLKRDEEWFKSEIGAVLCLAEKFENDGHNQGDQWTVSPIPPKTWYKNSIDFKQVPTPDFHPVSREKMKDAETFLHRKLSEGKTVYIHCKGGTGRSPQVLIAFLVRCHAYSLDDAIALVKSCRPSIKVDGAQRKILEESNSSVLSMKPGN